MNDQQGYLDLTRAMAGLMFSGKKVHLAEVLILVIEPNNNIQKGRDKLTRNC